MVADQGFDLAFDRDPVQGHVEQAGNEDGLDQQHQLKKEDAAVAQTGLGFNEDGDQGNHRALQGHDFDQGHHPAGAQRQQDREQDEHQNEIDAVDHQTISRVRMTAKKTRAKAVRMYLGTRSIFSRAMIDSTTPMTT